MVFPLALLLMGGAVAGKGRKDRIQEDRDSEDRAQLKKERDAANAERDRVVGIRAKMGDAASPVAVEPNVVKPDTMDNADVGDPRNGPMIQQGYRVGSQTYQDQKAASDAATAANAPEARTARMADVLMTAGDPLGAQTLRTGARQEQAAKLHLDEMQKAAIDREFDRHLQQVGNFDDLMKVISDSKSDGQGGGLKVQAQPSPDGKKVTVVQVNPDGTTAATPYSFENTTKGLLEAKQTLSRLTPTEAKLTHLHQNALEQQQAAQLAQQAQQHKDTLESQQRIASRNNATTLAAAKLHTAATLAAAGMGPDGKPAAGDNSIEAMAQAIARGDQPTPTGPALRNPAMRSIIARAAEINPNYGAANKVVKDFSTGKPGQSVRSFNVALSHLDTLGNLADALKNGNIQIINKVANEFAAQTGSTAPTNFDAAKKIVTDEIVKAIIGAGGTGGDREEAAKTVDRAKAPKQLAEVISTYKELMRGQLQGLRKQYEAGTGRDDFDRYLSPQAQGEAHGGGKGAAKAPPATNASGWALHKDAKGNMAYVSPDGKQFEEVK